MTKDIAKITAFQELGNELVVSLTQELPDIVGELEVTYAADNIPADLDEKENYQLVVTALREIKNPRISLEKNRKEVKETPLKLCKAIDEAARPYREKLEKIEAPWRTAKKKQDEKVEIEKREAARIEQERVDNINLALANIKALPGIVANKPSGEIKTAIETLEADDLSWADEFAQRVEQEKKETLERLNSMYASAVELEALRKAESERAEKEAEAEKKREAEEKARREAEDKKLAADREKLERDRAEFEEKQRQDAEEERKKKAAEDAERLKKEQEEFVKKRIEESEKKKKIAEAQRVKNIGEALQDLGDNAPLDKMIDAIIAGKIRHVFWRD